MKCCYGFTLIEIMMSISISMLLLLGLLNIIFTANGAHSNQVAMNSLQENARDVTHILTEAIHSAGYIGCAHYTDEFPLTNHTDDTFIPKNKINLYKGEEMKDNTEAFTIRRMGLNNASVIKNMRGKSVVYASNTISFSKGDVLLISNCQSADIFRVKDVIKQMDGTQKIMTEDPLSTLYDKNASISFLEVNTYYIGDTGRLDYSHAPVFALYVQDIHHYKTELVEGVDDMHIVINKRKGEVASASIELQLRSLGRFALQKKWFIYAAIRH